MRFGPDQFRWQKGHAVCMQLHPPPILQDVVEITAGAPPGDWDDIDALDHPPLPAVPVPAPAHSAAQAVARMVGETLMGQRSPQQLARWLTPAQCQQISEWSRRLRGQQVRLTRLQLVHIRPGRVEGFQIHDCAQRPISVTFRLDQVAGHWRCTQLAILLPGTAWRSARTAGRQ